MMNRLFIALDFPEEIIDEIVSIRDSIYGFENKPRWEKRDKLHLTVKFLGDVEEEKNKDIICSLDKYCNIIKGLSSEFNKFGLFYRDQKPAILWLGFFIHKSLLKFHSELENSLLESGFDKESRAFKPHLTLLRIKGWEDIAKIESFKNYNLGKRKFTFKSISLYKSELLKTGSVYTKIKSYDLI